MTSYTGRSGFTTPLAQVCRSLFTRGSHSRFFTKCPTKLCKVWETRGCLTFRHPFPHHRVGVFYKSPPRRFTFDVKKSYGPVLLLLDNEFFQDILIKLFCYFIQIIYRKIYAPKTGAF